MERKWAYDKLCETCDYGDHRCYFCGDAMDHEGWDAGGNEHTVAFCRPDLVEHEVGELCTWPWKNECYWDHERNELKPSA